MNKPPPLRLQKRIQAGSLRWIGQQVAGYSPPDIPIGASDWPSVASHLGSIAYQIGRIAPHNAVLIEAPPLRLLYVRPRYQGYRYAARRVFTTPLYSVDYDHVLGRHIAHQIGLSYVLLTRISRQANRRHGAFEKRYTHRKLPPDGLYFADRRILDKWLGRVPKLFNDLQRLAPYQTNASGKLGLTLKQAGQWGYALGVDHLPANNRAKLTQLKPHLP